MADLGEIFIGLNVDDSDVVRSLKTFDRMKTQIAQVMLAERKGEITKKQYNRAIQQMGAAFGKVTGDINSAKSAIQKYAYAIKDATDDQLKFQAASGKGMRRLEVLAQQAGYQIGDLAVQIQGGTNAMVALGQQGSQLLGFFGPAGAIAGAALAITTGFIAPFIRAKEEVESLSQITKEKMVELELLRKGFDVEEQLAAHNELKAAQEAEVKAQREYNDAVAAGKAPLEDIEATYGYQLEQARELVRLKEEEATGYSEVNLAIRKAEESAKKLTEEAIRLQEIEVRYLNIKEREAQALIDEQVAMEKRLKDYAIEKARASIKALQDQADAERKLFEDNLEYEKSQSLAAIEELGDAAEDLGTRLGISFSEALIIIRQAKAEAMVGLDAFGGAGSFKYSSPTTFDPNKGKKKGAKASDVVGDMLKQVRHQKKLLDLTAEEQRKEEILFELKKQDVKMSDKRIDQLVKESEAYFKLNEEREKQVARVDQIGDAFGDMLMNIVDGTMKADEAFKNFMANVIKQLYQEMAIDPAVTFLKSLLANGGVMSRGNLTPFANGGVVNGPTLFPMANGMGLMGEAGPEAIMPLKRGKDGKLGVEGGGNVVVNQTINVSTGVQQTVRTEIKSLMPQIAESAKAAVADAKRRGGSYGRNFA